MHNLCLAGDVILLTHPVVRWEDQCKCIMWVNVGDCIRINCMWRFETDSPIQYVTNVHGVTLYFRTVIFHVIFM